MSNRCELSDLFEDQCWHCRGDVVDDALCVIGGHGASVLPHPRVIVVRRRRCSPGYETCAICGDRIASREPVSDVDGACVCERCFA
jgi:hypothetical protein